MISKILVLEDDKNLASLVEQHLLALRYDVVTCGEGDTGLQLAERESPDLILLDLGLPGMDGLDICREFRKLNSVTPILILTARNSEMDRVLGLELGADDYLGKPFSLHELQARVKAILRRQHVLQSAALDKDKPIRCKNLEIYPARREILLNNNKVQLTAREFDLLYFLASHSGKVFNRSQLLNHIWGYTSSIYEHTVNSNINRLRNKIEREHNNPEFVITVRGVGYKFNDELMR